MDDNIQIPSFDLGGKQVSFDVLKYIPIDSANYYKFVPVGMEDGVLLVGMIDPHDIDARDAIQFIASKENVPFKLFSISQEDYQAVLKSYQGLNTQVDTALGDIQVSVKEQEKILAAAAPERRESNIGKPSIIEEAPVTKIVGVILQHAVAGSASDIHIEPVEDKVKVRFRVDGTLYTSLFLPKTVHEAVVARIKILTNMKLDEKRKPQDGRFSTKIDGRKIDLRVSTLPTYFGEKVVMRILDPEKKILDLKSLGMSDDQYSFVQEAINRPYGLILITGPTGSGKSTTLYAMLNSIEKEGYNVVSLEDPIEYSIPGVNQSQVQPEIKYTFANGLRTIMRQDPDIIMVGEIRDKVTARLAIQAALTGHLVFSTLHTNSAIGVVPRLIDMGIDPYLIPPTLVMAIGQRLVPLLYPESKEEMPLDESVRMMIEKQIADLPPTERSKFDLSKKIYRPKGAPSYPSGLRGRMAVFEFLPMDNDLEKLVLKNAGESEIYEMVRKKGFITMKEDAIRKALDGLIPFEEVNKL